MKKFFIGCVIGYVFVLLLAPGFALAQEATRYKLTDESLTRIASDVRIPEDIRNELPGRLGELVNNEYATEDNFRSALKVALLVKQEDYIPLILDHAVKLDIDMGKVMNILMKFLIWAVVFEVTLTPIFNWRKFLERFDGIGAKVPITLIVVLLVFWNLEPNKNYQLNIFVELLEAMNITQGLSRWGQWWGRILTAFLIAGGSDGILRIFDKIGIRNLEATKEKAEEAQRALAERNRKRKIESEKKARQRTLDKKKLQAESA